MKPKTSMTKCECNQRGTVSFPLNKKTVTFHTNRVAFKINIEGLHLFLYILYVVKTFKYVFTLSISKF